MSKSSIKIAVVGDVHDLWEPLAEKQALDRLGVDLVLFVGDFGNEAIEVVEAIAALDLPKAAILGNHDAWYTASDKASDSNKPNKKQCPYDRTQEDRVQRQIDALGQAHVGFGWLDFPEFRLSVVGARPFSWGGSRWKKAEFYRDRYGIKDFGESTQKIMRSVASTSQDTIIFIGHSGPFGLGAETYSICGRDWKPKGGDYGDPDFADAISKSYALAKNVPLVTFGHMHHHLKNNANRTREAIATNDQGTIFLNSACSPRIIKHGGETYRNFSIVTLESGSVQKIVLTWLNSACEIMQEKVLFAA